MLIRNLILGPLTQRDDGETVLIQDYGLTAYVGWNPSRMEQRNGRIDRKLQREQVVRCLRVTCQVISAQAGSFPKGQQNITKHKEILETGD